MEHLLNPSPKKSIPLAFFSPMPASSDVPTHMPTLYKQHLIPRTPLPLEPTMIVVDWNWMPTKISG
jgi:hypothetical protein